MSGSLHTVPTQVKYGLVKKSGQPASNQAPSNRATAGVPVRKTNLSAFDLDENEDEEGDAGELNHGQKQSSSSSRAGIDRVNKKLYGSAPLTRPSLETTGVGSVALDSAGIDYYDFDGNYDSFKKTASQHHLSQAKASDVPVRRYYIY